MEIIALITQAKTLGLDPGGLVNLLIMYILLTRHFDKKLDKKFDQLIVSEKEFKESVTKDIKELKTHVGFKLKET